MPTTLKPILGTKRRGTAGPGAVIPPFDRYPSDRAVPWRIALLAVAVAAALFLAVRVLPAAPAPVADLVAGAGHLLTRAVSRLTGLVPVAAGEVLIGAYLVWLAAMAVRAARACRGRRRRWRNALACGATRRLRDAAAFVFSFYLLWGHNYSRASLERSAGWPEWVAPETEQLIALAEDAVAAANAAYIQLHGTVDAGQPTSFMAGADETQAALDEGYRRAAALLDLPSYAAASYGAVKFPLLGHVLIRFGILGVYFPWTGEANVVGALPAMQLAHTMAHEKAHQRGFASEADANFLGFMAAALAPDPLSRYSAAMFAHLQLSGSLRGVPRELRRELAERRLPGVRRDIEDLAAFYDRFRGPARRVGSAVNDRYLKVNGVRGGVASYGRSVRLLIAYALDNDGRVMPVWTE